MSNTSPRKPANDINHQSKNMSTLAHSNQPGSFTCNSCQIRFPTAELQRVHMKSEWHRYNLKRRVAGLGPVNAVTFRSKIVNSQRQAALNSNQDEYGFHVHRKAHKGERQLTKKDLKKLAKRGRPETKTEVEDLQRYRSPSESRSSRVSQFSLGSVDTEVSFASTLEDVKSDIVETDSGYEIETSDDEDSAGNSTEEEEGEEDSDDDDQLEEIPLNFCFYCGSNNDNIEHNVSHMFTKHGLYLPEREFLADVEGLLKMIAETVYMDNECLKCGFVGKNLTSIRQHVVNKGHCVLPYETREEREAVRQFYDFKLENSESESEDEYTTATIRKTSELELPNGRVLGNRALARNYRQTFPRRERDVYDGELTVAAIQPQNELIVAAREHNRQQLKEAGILDTKRRTKAISHKLKNCNNMEYYRPQIL